MYSCLYCGKKLQSVNMAFCDSVCKRKYLESMGIDISIGG